MQPKRVTASTCAYCGVGCGIDITAVDNVAVELQGAKAHPANLGRLCIKGSHLLETVDITGRLLTPQINNIEVPWSQATQTVADALLDTIARYGKNSVAFYASGQLLTEDYYVANKLMKGYIGAGNIDTNSRLCMSSAVSAYKRAFGEDVVPCDYKDLETTQLLILTGSNAAWTHPVLFQRIEHARKINPDMKVVVIDPRCTVTAQSADLFLPIKPGTDAALFNGLLHYLAKHQGIDKAYIAQHTEGFEAAFTAVKTWTIEKVAGYCGINVKDLQSLYGLFCESTSAVTLYSMGINQSTSGVDKCNAIINCHLASGKIAKAGSGPFSITGQPNAMGGREVGGLANQLTAHLDIENSAHRRYVQQYWQSPTMVESAGKSAIEMFDAVIKGDIKAIWIMGTNPLVSVPNSEKIKLALKQCPLVIVSDCIAENDTLAFADIKLPATPWLEKNGTVTNSERTISRQRSVHNASGLARPDWKIIADVAKAMGFTGFDYLNESEIFTEFAGLTAPNKIASRVFDISALAQLTVQEYEQLQPIQWPVPKVPSSENKRVFQAGKFSTPNGRARFIPISPRMPEHQLSEQFPFTLNSGRLRDHWHTMTRTGLSSTLTQHTDKPCIYLNPKDMRELKIKENTLIGLSSEFTQTKEQVIVFAKADNGVLQKNAFMPIHWNKQFSSHANVSYLYIGNVDPISYQPEMKQAAIQISKPEFATQGYCFISDKMNKGIDKHSFIDGQNNAVDFWLKNKTCFGTQYSIAHNQRITDALLWSQQLVSNNNASSEDDEWLCFQNGSTSYVILLRQKSLMLVNYFSTIWPTYEPLWLAHVFSKDRLVFSDIQALLLGQASSEYVLGKQVCACYNVAENSIINAIESGAKTIEALGEKLKCGTGCGSCKPELHGLIKQYQSVDVVNAAVAVV